MRETMARLGSVSLAAALSVSLFMALWLSLAAAPTAALAETAAPAASLAPAATLAPAEPAEQGTIELQETIDPEAATEAHLATLDEETRAKSKSYTESGYWLSVLAFLYGLAVAWFLLGSGLSARMRDLGERATRRKPVQTALYGVQYVLITTLLLLPLSVYAGYVREHRYGFSTQDLGGYVNDRLIGFALSLVLLSALLVILYGVIRRARKTWWIWGAGVGLGFLAVLTFVFPVYIAPLFNRYEPLDEGPLKERVLAMARANGVPADEVYQYDASKRTTKISANVSGLFGTTRISLNDNLLDRGTEPEIVAVMAHEIGHFALHSTSEYFLFFGVFLVVGFVFVHWGFDRALNRWGAGWGVREIGDVAGFPLLGLLLSVYAAALTPVTNGFIRSNEVEADIYGLNAARQPDGFASIILKLGEYRKVDPGPLEEWFFYDHPSARNRILMAMRWKAEQGAVASGDGNPSSSARGRAIGVGTAPEVWSIPPESPCTGVTVGWTPSLDVLQQVVGPRWVPVEGPTPGRGVFLLFAASCDASTLAGEASGPFTVGAAIVRVEPGDSDRLDAGSWAAIPDNFGAAGEPVLELFRRHGFVATEAEVSLDVRGEGGEEVHFRIGTAEGLVEATATFEPATEPFEVTSALVGTDPYLFSIFTGPESAVRQAEGTAVVRSTGTTWVSRLRLQENPPIVALDRDFIWEFTFQSESF